MLEHVFEYLAGKRTDWLKVSAVPGQGRVQGGAGQAGEEEGDAGEEERGDDDDGGVDNNRPSPPVASQ